MALTVDKADVLLFAAELSTVSDAQWDAIWADVELEVSLASLGSQARVDRLALQLAAHLATMRHVRAGGSSAPGSLQSVTVGGVSKTFSTSTAAATSDAQALEATKYGQEYRRLVRLFGRRMELT